MKRILSSLKFWLVVGVVALAVGAVAIIWSSKQAKSPVQANDLLNAADPKMGATLAKSCMACHSFNQGDTEKKVGPNLFGIVGAVVGSKEHFAYSEALLAMKKRGAIWTTDELYEWLRDPEGYAPGTIMSYGGMLDPQDRMDLIAYLMTLK